MHRVQSPGAVNHGRCPVCHAMPSPRLRGTGATCETCTPSGIVLPFKKVIIPFAACTSFPCEISQIIRLLASRRRQREYNEREDDLRLIRKFLLSLCRSMFVQRAQEQKWFPSALAFVWLLSGSNNGFLYKWFQVFQIVVVKVL